MVRRLLVGVGVIGFLVVASSPLGACGDKFLLVGRALKYRQTSRSPHPASILAYTQSPRVADLVGKQGLGALLKLVGHQVRVVDSPAELQRTLKTESFDVVIAPAETAAELRTHAGGAEVVPILFAPSNAEARSSEKTFGCVLKIPSQGAEVLATVDRAVALKLGHSATH